MLPLLPLCGTCVYGSAALTSGRVVIKWSFSLMWSNYLHRLACSLRFSYDDTGRTIWVCRPSCASGRGSGGTCSPSPDCSVLRSLFDCLGSPSSWLGWKRSELCSSRLNIVCIRLVPSTTYLVTVRELIISLDKYGATWYRPWALCGWCYPITYNALGDC